MCKSRGKKNGIRCGRDEACKNLNRFVNFQDIINSSKKKIQTPKETSKTLSQNGFTNPSYHLKGDNAYNIQIFPEKRKEGTLWQQNQVKTG